MKFRILVIVIYLGFSVCSLDFALAMGEMPSTREVVTPTIEFVREFGLPGSGERQFNQPYDIDVAVMGDMETGLGNLFVVDTGNNRIQRIDEDGGFVYQFGRFGSEKGLIGAPPKFNTPSGIAVDFNFRVYVSEKDNDRVQVFDIRGNYLGEVATGEISYKTLYDPAGLDVDSLGNLFIADSGNDRILKFNDLGGFLGSVGSFGSGFGFFDGPSDVAVDTDQYLYVTDTRNHRVQKLNYNGEPVLTFGGVGSEPGQMSGPQGIAVDNKFVYVADTGNNRIQIFTRSGEFVLAYGRKGYGRGEFNNPIGICLGKKGQVYVADTSNNRLQELRITYEK